MLQLEGPEEFDWSRHASQIGGLQMQPSAQHVQQAPATQTIMAQALGLVMGFHGCDSGQATALLAQVSQLHTIDVGDLAASLVAIESGRDDSVWHGNLDALMAQAVGTVLLTRVAPEQPSPKLY